MPTFVQEHPILAPVDAAWPVMSDVARWHEWTASITRVEVLTPGPLSVGSRARVVQPGLVPGTWTFTAWEPGRRFTWTMRQPGIRCTGDHELTPTPDGCRVRLTLDFHGPVGWLAARLGAGLVRRYMTMEAEGLAARSEGRR